MPAVRRHLPTGWDYVGGLEASPGLRDENFLRSKRKVSRKNADRFRIIALQNAASTA
jgi:hypothetical protein